MQTRRTFLNLAARAAGASFSAFAAMPVGVRAGEAATVVNDVHSQLNATRVARAVFPSSEEELKQALAAARSEGRQVSIAGGRHSMGGQQFASDGVLIDTRGMNRVLSLDENSGVVEVEGGMLWPDLIDQLITRQVSNSRVWGIVQKQTGADRLSIGGALGSNIHGRGLAFKPMIGDVESFTLMDADGRLMDCSRSENGELFRLAIGGYGLFGIVTRVKLRLMPRTKLERVVKIVDVEELMPAFERRMSEGFLYGDCQFSTDAASDGFLRTGVFSCYRPLPPDALMPEDHRELSQEDWRKLYYLSHADTRRAYEAYSSYYLTTSGQRYWSDTHQLSVYIDDYHIELDRRLGAENKGTEMITELYVPRAALGAFLAEVREDFRKHAVQLIYGTIRLIAKDDESFLAWAREPWVCTVMNLHIDHTEERIAKAADDFRRLIDRAIARGGSYFLTYHRWARRDQVERCYPQFPAFLKLKRRYDPGEVFASDWYRHYKAMFAGDL
jgi:FAD/FMN-containing dehydrogenase